ncbi:hypothetical protein MKZ08_18085 [Viridibacillus sp. FSL R5-0477]|uniref:hypothetical protein n=1 Tax=Viridibacillus TaxID=496496 RepID=UPI0004B36A1E|nr:hypothetical protein [Viridibacillus arenosi]
MTTYLTDYAYFTNKDYMEEAVKLHISAHWNNMNNLMEKKPHLLMIRFTEINVNLY